MVVFAECPDMSWVLCEVLCSVCLMSGGVLSVEWDMVLYRWLSVACFHSSDAHGAHACTRDTQAKLAKLRREILDPVGGGGGGKGGDGKRPLASMGCRWG